MLTELTAVAVFAISNQVVDVFLDLSPLTCIAQSLIIGPVDADKVCAGSILLS